MHSLKGVLLIVGIEHRSQLKFLLRFSGLSFVIFLGRNTILTANCLGVPLIIIEDGGLILLNDKVHLLVPLKFEILEISILVYIEVTFFMVFKALGKLSLDQGIFVQYLSWINEGVLTLCIRFLRLILIMVDIAFRTLEE